ncbi:hypothetical protein BDZ89DRAFT_1139660 [Hymenopellis radicata]|nr:hypothetical protein BDZ89DRAFT_1139660 [Hymenopellis radicata]
MGTTLKDAFMALSPPTLGREGGPKKPKYHAGNFLDTHLDENLVLRRVESHPTLITELAALVDKRLDSFPNRHMIPDHFFGCPARWYRNAADMNTAESIAKTHEVGAGFVAAQLASSILIHPNQPQLVPPLSWGASQMDTCDDHSSTSFLVEHYFLRFNDYKGTRIKSLDKFLPETRPKLLSLSKQYPRLAVTMFFCPAAHDLLRNMDSLLEVTTFAWTANSSTQYASSGGNTARPNDSRNPPWSLPKLVPVAPREHAIRRSHRKDSPMTVYCAPGKLTPAIKRDGRDTPEQYIQRAWANAVRADASVIIFDCGNFLRIGIRHRETQTLFLSKLFDVCHDKDPAYGRIWAGLHLAIVEDVLQRYEAAGELTQEFAPRAGEKRPSPDDDTRINKKSRSPPLERPHTGNGTTKAVSTAAGRRRKGSINVLAPNKSTADTPLKRASRARKNIEGTTAQMNRLEHSLSRHSSIALYVRLGIYNSPSPSILLHPGVTRCESYSSTNNHPNIRHGPIVVKLATTLKRLCRLRHEFSIYERLKAAKVNCIPRVFGFYQDGHRDVGALILSHNGHPIANRNTLLSVDAKNRLKEALLSIHAAGVLHRDIRYWNVLVDDAGHFSVIDFDRATTSASDHEFRWELERLEKLLRGEYINDAQVIGKDGMASNIRDLVNDNGDI